jgi:Ca2+-binding RTX toxin-like protein
MTTGTEGNDTLTNDTSLFFETVDALGGDDEITLIARTNGGYVTVNGGAGTDTLIFAPSEMMSGFTATGSDGKALLRKGSSTTEITFSSIERLEFTGGLRAAGPDPFNFGEITVILDLALSVGSPIFFTGGGNDEITIRHTGTSSLYREVNSGGGDDVVILLGTGSDKIVAGAGNDYLDGGDSYDELVGGTGDDIYVVSRFGDLVTEAADEGVDEVRTSAGSRNDHSQIYVLPANVENLTGTYETGQGVSANALNNVVAMGAGGDLVVLDSGGNDQVDGGGGNDYLYYGGAFTSADSNVGGEGSDTLGLVGNYTIAFDADDLVSIEKLAVYSSGNAAQPAGYALTSHDANVAAGQELTIAGRSLAVGETLSFNGAAELDGHFRILSGAGADALTGGAKRDTIDGGAGDDTIHGGDGKDVIIGGAGADSLFGDAGADRFVYKAASESASGAPDQIKDFQAGVDKINLRQVDANGNAGDGVTPFSFIGSDAFTGQAGQLRALSNGGASYVEADINGDGLADFALLVTVSNALPLTRNDFEL